MRWIAVVMLVLAGCSHEMAPAQRAISDIDRNLRAAAPEAGQYVPEQLGEVRGELGGLRAAYERGDYAAVLRDAPAVMNAVQALGGAAAARKNAMLKELNDAWAVLAVALPDDVAAIQNRIDLLSRNVGRKPPAAGIDVDAARATLSRDASLWSKAQASFATGNMEQAVTIARTLQSQLRNLASSLKVELTEPPAAAEIESASIRAPAYPR